MKVLFAGGNGYTPQFSGGVQSSTHHLAEQLLEHGHEASVLAALFGQGVFGYKARAKMKLLRQRAVIDSYPGYPVVRAWFPWEAARFAVERLDPDVAVVQCHKSVPIGKALQALGVPLVVYLRNVEFHELGGDLRELHSALYIANSEFTARTYKAKFDIDSTVIPPTINPALYSTPTTGEFVTLINPYNEKGFELAVRIAGQCSEIPFLFVESWKLDDDHRAQIERTIAPLRNVRLESRTSDMKTVYSRTKILLAPSKWEEAWGRVASEAHCSGIPVVGSRRGGLPEAIGAGGVVLDYDAPLDDWAAAIRRLWNDSQEYERLSAAAREFSERPALDPERQFATFFSMLGRAAQQGSRQAA
ncbi:MAG: glycosyltransferase [Mesorhizobium sp.]|uniref:glycosyltransferase n=1 Tax=unclassified Mesorhizobium TaxID=325217 RepID=UPI0007ED575D|nr:MULTISPECIES: glycosyltransferase [unclassified Mesorhizobium]RUV72146.1 glycosyltransferase [Mesorhizobium sp. M5C.F.Ca.IN.020.14.1.1]QIA20522.1 glycosyltransferase family 4 protein [Mesorhizobium sp. AA22]RUV28774.1 glycosyltransferase [Mesorhizobium sp. M5C.F.Ca.IN.020.32.2.1]RWC46846.1 MAG: glycosyltransferase [Mesorhizobium sp.]RWD50200.1 MAG: glycosyltransferase [Mesorhizobium sp.]